MGTAARSVTPPVRELKGFERVTLRAWQSRVVRFELAASDLMFWWEGAGWVVEDGEFTVMVGPCSAIFTLSDAKRCAGGHA